MSQDIAIADPPKDIPWYKRINKHETWEMTKPWLSAGASVAGVKALYDVPEYFREKLELKGLKVGNKTFGGGLAQATSDLLESSGNVRDKTQAKDAEGGETSNDLYKQLSKLSDEGKSDSDAYKKLEERIEATRPTAVRDAIAKVNKKLALTKEGGVKNSEARKEMARILRENRRAEKANRDEVKSEVTTLLDDYTNQKVDGITAAKESLRAALTVSGASSLAAAGTLTLDAVGFAKQTTQTARREGEDVTTGLLAKKFAEAVKDNWDKLKGTDETGTKTTGQIWTGRMQAAAKFARVGAIAEDLGLNADAYKDDVGKLAEMSIDKIPMNFSDHLGSTAGKLENLGTRAGIAFISKRANKAAAAQPETSPQPFNTPASTPRPEQPRPAAVPTHTASAVPSAPTARHTPPQSSNRSNDAPRARRSHPEDETSPQPFNTPASTPHPEQPRPAAVPTHTASAVPSASTARHTPPQTSNRSNDAPRARRSQRGQGVARNTKPAAGKHKKRLSGGTKGAMILVALLLDMAPLLLGVAGLVFIFTGITDVSSCAQVASSYIEEGGGGFTDKAAAVGKNLGAATKCAFSGGAALVTMGAAGFAIGPAVYLLGSLVSVMLAYLFIFPIWFATKKVHVFSFNGARILANFFGFVIESIPLINILPGITLWTIGQIAITSAEDVLSKPEPKGGKRQLRA